ncbi:MAG: type II toxin-antitoxin system prevent-host-death family antitoxin [Rhodospirillales bacterium]|nr:type II toxin-antitoxin system prevent-host-death family antitoxin [Rhodospirillales bacterium]
MEIIGATEARANFAELLRRVSAEGERIVIERRGKPRAVLVPLGEEEGDERRTARAGWRNTGTLFNETERLARLGHWEWDEVEDRCVYCSEELARLHGVSVEEFLRRASSLAADLDWVHPEDRQRYLDATDRLRKKGQGFQFEYRLRQPDGGYLEVREESEPVFDEQGSVIRSFGFVQDITERKQAERDSRESAALLAQAAQMASLGHWVWDEIENRCVYCSETLARMIDVTVEEYLANYATMEALLADTHPEDRERYARVIADAKRDRRAYDVEFRDVRPNGEVRFLRERGEPVFDAAGRHVRTVGTLQDITEHRQAVTALRESEAALAKAQQLAHIGNWRWSVERDKLVSGSEEYARIHGVAPEQIYELMKHDFEQVIHPEDRERTVEAFRRFDEESCDYEIAYRIVRPDGEVRHVFEIGEAVRDDSGRAVEQIGTVQDVTEFKRIEEELRRAGDELELRVAERTAELQMANQQLREEEAKLREILENSPFGVAIVSHSMDGTRLTGNRLFVNSALVRMFGAASRESFVKANIEDSWVNKGQLKAVEDIFKSGRELVDFEVQRRRMDGSLWWVVMNARPIRFDDQDCTMVWHFDITARKQAEAALKKSEARLAKALQQAKLAHWSYRFAERKIEGWSEEAANILGIATKDLPKRFETYLELVHPEDRAGVAGIYEVSDPANPKREAYQTEHRITRPDGAIAWLLESSEVEYGEDGVPVGYLGTIQDITERKETEEAVKRREAQLRRTQRMARIGDFAWDAVEDRCVFCSEELAELMGVTVEEFIADNDIEAFLQRIHPDDRARFEAVTGRAMADFQSYEVEYREIGPDGSLRYWREIGEPTEEPQGRRKRFLCTVQDITAIKRTEAALRESEERLNQAVRLAGLGHWVWDAVADRCSYCSEENARIHGMSVEDYMTKASAVEGDFAMVHPEDRREIKALFQALRKGREFEKEYRLITPAGETRHIREVAKPVFGADGRVVQEFGTIQDITEQKQTEEQLRQAQKMEAVGQLTGGVAHDFNNLLAVVTGNAELLALQLGEDDPKVQAALRAAGRGAALTQQLLAFSRRQALQPRVLDLNALVGGMEEMLSRSLGEAIDIRTSLDEGLWRALADPGQVENALLNLAINARDAMPDGGTLVIETGNANLDDAYAEGQPEVAQGDYVVLAVTDSGSGMAPGVLEHAFEPFFTTKEVGRGTGLGLSMVYGFAKQSDGHVAIYSEEGHGTTVKLYLPRTEAPADAPGPVEMEAPQGCGETVLLVEGNADVRLLAERLLGDLGYRVFTAEDARTALTVLDRIPQPDLLLSDVVLPGGLSGPDLAKQALELYPGLKVLFMSGYAEHAGRINGLAGKGAELLNKPFRKRDLALKLRAVLDRGQ